VLTEKQKHILYEEGTEAPGSSSLNYEKREGDYVCAACGAKLFESKNNTKVEVDGRHSLKHYLMYLRLQLIT
jgi:peptide methionine sulfoxide reductase MsrB